MTVELIYFRDCPNVSLTRARLLQAFAATGMSPHWQEWDRDDPASPARARAYGSPTVLVNGREVTDMEPTGEAASSCRVYAQTPGAYSGAPAVDSIITALREANAGAPMHSEAPRAGWRSSLAALPAIGAAALPKLTCPACWPAYSGLLSSMGLGFINYTPFLLPLTTAFLLLSLTALGWRAPRRRGYGPLLVGIAASIALVVGKFAFDSDAAMYAGLAALVAASLWNAWPRTQRAAGICPACVTSVTEP